MRFLQMTFVFALILILVTACRKEKEEFVPNPEMTIVDNTVNEGEIGFISVNLSKPATATITFDYATVDGSAIGGQDFDAANGTLTIPQGDSTTSISLSTTSDTDTEGNEWLNIIISNAINADIVISEASITIAE